MTTAQAVRPEHDCPPCPECTMTIGTPINSAQVERWDGPEDATLFCPACGTGWVGTPADVAQAEASWAAYEELERSETR